MRVVDLFLCEERGAEHGREWMERHNMAQIKLMCRVLEL